MALLTAWLVVALVVLVVVAAAGWKRYARSSGVDPTLKIGAPRYVEDDDGRSDYRPELREKTLERREKADAARRHANLVDTGGATTPRLAVTDRRRA